MMTRRAPRRAAAAVAQRPKKPAAVAAPRCQCAAGGAPCDKPAIPGAPFCHQHTSCPLSPRSGSEPDGVVQAKRWSDFAIELAHNCYAWAMQFNNPDFIRKCREQNGRDCRKYFPQPGAKSGERNALDSEERRSCGAVEKLMLADVPGITKSSYYGQCPAGSSKIALVVSPRKDYHFYLQTKPTDTTLGKYGWLHKDGSNPVKDFDANKQPIANPETASRDYRPQGSDLNYSDFCGFYCVPRTSQIVLAQGGSRGGARLPRGRKTRRAPRLPRKAQRFGLA
jgi:hypothetical protein